MNKKFFYAVAATLALSASSLFAQGLKVPAPSPAQTIKQAYALGEITIDYSRPSVKDRVIFGDLVPYGKTWRTGANASTKITFSDDVKLEGKDVKAGTYALYTVPNKDSWDILLYSDLTLGGNTSKYNAENEVLRVSVKPTTLAAKVETFTINFADVTPTTTTIELLWDKTRVPVKISTEVDATIMKNIESAMTVDSRTYFQSAVYYYENDKDLKQALTWINKAVEQNPKAFYMMMAKSRIEYKMGDKKAALASAEKTVALAKEAQNDDYVKMGEQMIADAKKK